MFRFLLLLSLLFGLNAAHANELRLNKQTTKDLDIAVHQVLKALQSTDGTLSAANEDALNELIDKQTGVYIIFRRGVYDNFIHTDKIDIAHPIPDYLPYVGVRKTYYPSRFKSTPKFDCETEKWRDWGMIVDVNHHYAPLTQIALMENQAQIHTHTEQELATYRDLESKTVKIVVTAEDAIFYMSLLNGRWYLTAWDRMEYCSA